MKKNGFKIAVWYVLIIALVIVVIAALSSRVKTDTHTYGQIIEYFEKEQVKEFVGDYNKDTLT
ncbi:MAG: hypothetical protein IJ499_04780, partial [Clostridia bacterium]|nr:hypothetical protein [Clostridia bacterium]